MTDRRVLLNAILALSQFRKSKGEPDPRELMRAAAQISLQGELGGRQPSIPVESPLTVFHAAIDLCLAEGIERSELVKAYNAHVEAMPAAPAGREDGHV